MLEIRKINSESDFLHTNRQSFVEFLHTHLGQYGDPVEDIQNCLSYAFSKEKSEGGFALTATLGDELVGALIMNRTGMENYIPGWVLVYVAVDEKYRGKGFGEKIIRESFRHTNGRVKLHVEYENPAKRLYERIGFSSKYAEMRIENPE